MIPHSTYPQPPTPNTMSRVMIHHAAIGAEDQRIFPGASPVSLDSGPAPPSLVGVRSQDRQGHRLRHLPFDTHRPSRWTTQHLRLLIASCGRLPTRPRVVVPPNSSSSLPPSKWSSVSACHPSQRNRQLLVMLSRDPRGRLSPTRRCGLRPFAKSKLPPSSQGHEAFRVVGSPTSCSPQACTPLPSRLL